MSKLGIFLLDNLNQVSEEIKIKKPKNYEQLLKQLDNKYKNIEKNYELFILNNDNKETIINNEGKYDTIDDILFLREKNKKNISKSLQELYPSLISESKRETSDEKYSCILCSIIIKNEKPFLCYKCQKIFHAKCLKEWDEKCKLQNRSLICPNCRNESPIENWNKKLDYEENIKENEDLINKLYENKIKDNMNINMNQIKDKKINELKLKFKKQNQLIKTYGKYIEKSMTIFKNILTKINSIHSLLNFWSIIIIFPRDLCMRILFRVYILSILASWLLIYVFIFVIRSSLDKGTLYNLKRVPILFVGIIGVRET